MDESAVTRSAQHPRINQPMRVIDMVVFTAEHDDHHVACIAELARKLQR
jgi:mannitol/fructose-specific phosphotransferase system IIA component (Ntr-type)